MAAVEVDLHCVGAPALIVVADETHVAGRIVWLDVGHGIPLFCWFCGSLQ
jgi:hypothetical protein